MASSFQPDDLPAPLARQLDGLVHNIFVTALQGCAADAASATRISSAIKDRVSSALSPALRAHNSALVCARVPAEVWCEIWERLDLRNRLAVTRVSHAWRVMATSTPRIWSRLNFYSSLHGTDCDCEDCGEESNPDYQSSNFSNFECALKWSRPYPLSVRIYIDAIFCDDREIIELAQALEPHTPHLRTITFVTGDGRALPAFFNAFQEFPALEQLELIALRDEYGIMTSVEPEDAVFESRCSLPMLKDLESDWPLTSAVPTEQLLHVPQLESLTCVFVSEDNLISTLSACPMLETLHLNMRLAGANYALEATLPDFHRTDDLRNLLSHLTSIYISSITFGSDMAKALDLPSCPRIDLELQKSSRTQAYQGPLMDVLWNTAPVSDLTVGSRQVAEAINLGFFGGHWRVVVEGRDITGRVRRLLVPQGADHLSRIWPQVPFATSASVTIHADTWFWSTGFSEKPATTSFHRVHHLTLIVSYEGGIENIDLSKFVDFYVEIAEKEEAHVYFPELQELVIRAVQPTKRVRRTSRAELSRLVCAIIGRDTGPLPRVILQGISLKGTSRASDESGLVVEIQTSWKHWKEHAA
ncbi:hypothetical protein EXIGLDRAFT_845753 [Exidia glandulosa HHB12029]|uniref:F-box domain-containing protein n=1 Tax=Exidia glandulosa HHB12029 TaxID=1314781 RepID=A0A165BAX1_EXIGL|nr:hypothetical protein EXIGLDRAFT_845753 [Exidia glandulosa HHB12029]